MMDREKKKVKDVKIKWSNTGSRWKRNRGDIITAYIICVYWSANQQQQRQQQWQQLQDSRPPHTPPRQPMLFKRRRGSVCVLCYVCFLLCRRLSNSKCNKYRETSYFVFDCNQTNREGKRVKIYNSLFDTDLFVFSFC